MRRSSRPRAASGAGRQPAQTALASRCAGARSWRTQRGYPANVTSKLVLGLSCVAEGLHVAFLSEFDYAGEELRSWVRLVPIAVMGMLESALRPSPGQSDKTSFIRIDGGCVV